ncbi:peptidyl-tRNA hydrolase II [Schizophyllum commune H4-8]|uniref:peptidyl-tRNA hydrolase n=1 Tax=Schizophyllum commune (strain H4-8 / FGSC 9210) TaxID=578458 RepID=D8PN67_SCHCM|nr:peptidyl-tRNA hydrolase II [Schizophyllum commune H4-8]KAI5898645.1 peptidyl-tRNA hydrolase II [Schizophyllum commune H4-8]
MSYTTTQLSLAAAITVASLALGFVVGKSETEAEIAREVIPGSSNLASGSAAAETEAPQAIPDGDLAAVKAGYVEPCKLVLVVRTDLKLPAGKIAERCGDATLASYKTLIARNPQLVKHWERTGQAKIALKGSSQKQLEELERTAKGLNLCARAIQDDTAKDGPATVILAIGPAPVDLVNRVTGKLRLL